MTALRAKAPEKKDKRAKVLIYGEPGTWKTSLLCRMPRNYIIDGERGTEEEQYVDWMTESGSRSFFTNSLDDVITEVRALMTTPNHGFINASIDPITVPYYEEGDRAAVALASGKDDPKALADAMTYQRHMNSAKLKLKRILRLCKHLDMNVWIITHAKQEWKDGNQTGRLIPDCWDGLRYDFDLILEATKRGKERWARVEKSRIKGFPEGETFLFTFEEVSARFGRESMAREAVARELATSDQLSELRRALEGMKDGGADVLAAMMKEEDVSDPSDLSAAFVQRAIDHYKNAPVQA